MELRKAKSAAVSSMPIMYAWNVCIWLDDDYDSDFGFYCSGETEKCGSSAWITTKPSFRMRANHWLTVMYGDLDQCWNPIKRVGKPERELALRNPNQFPQLAIVSRSCPSTEKKSVLRRRKREKNLLLAFFMILRSRERIHNRGMLWLWSSVPLIGSERSQNSAILFLSRTSSSDFSGEGLRLSFFLSRSSTSFARIESNRLLSHETDR